MQALEAAYVAVGRLAPSSGGGVRAGARPMYGSQVGKARVAGMADPLIYPGSYSDWVTSGMPVAIGEEPFEAVEH